MILNQETIDAYTELLMNPNKHGLNFKALNKCFENSDKVTAKHILYEQYIQYLKKPLPKALFYIIMDKLYPSQGKDEHGYFGYYLRLINF